MSAGSVLEAMLKVRIFSVWLCSCESCNNLKNTDSRVRLSQIFVIALTVQGVLRVHYGSPPDGDFTLRRSIVADEKGNGLNIA